MSSIVLLVFIITFGYTIYLKEVNGVELRPLQKFEDIQIPQNLDCSSMHLGKFETGNSIIERIDSRQIQTDKRTGEIKELNVEWKSNCEYVLTSKDRSEQISVKIVDIKQDSYSCYVISNKFKDKYPNFIIMNRIK